MATNICPCGTTIERRSHIAGECEIYKEERDALEEEMRKLDVSDMKVRIQLKGKSNGVSCIVGFHQRKGLLLEFT